MTDSRSCQWLCLSVCMILGTCALPIGAVAIAAPKEPPPRANALDPVLIPHFHLTGNLVETPMEDPFNFLAGELTSTKELLRRLGEAADDERVKAVALTLDRMVYGFGQLEEIRGALNRIKASGKPVLVHAHGVSMPTYALLSEASRLSVAPRSTLWLTGLYGEAIYVKGLLDMIGVEADMLQSGAYKSASEMLTRTEPTEPARENMEWLMDSLYGSLVAMISESRGITEQQVRHLIDHGPYLAERAVEVGLIDAAEDRATFQARIASEFGIMAEIDSRYAEKASPTINFANPFAIFQVFAQSARRAKKTKEPRIALVFVEGMILPGHAQSSPFGSGDGAFGGDVGKALATAANDPTVKAVVMRVDSPGGSAEASEVILNAARMVKLKKPLIVSMGNVAGSGGYYVSCHADAIFANRTTITASIGVVGGKLVTTEMWDKLGVNWIGYQRGADADLFNTTRRFDDSQRTKISHYMDEIYDAFRDHVVKGRASKLAKPIEDVAEGRVFTGAQALELGLVDRIGGLSDAIQFAADRAELKNYELLVIPEPNDFLTNMIERMSGKDERSTDLATPAPMMSVSQLRDVRQAIHSLRQVDPARADAFLHGLQCVDLIQRDGVALMMSHQIVWTIPR